MSANLVAFFAAISHGEGTDLSADPYRVVYGFDHTIVDFSDHPYLTGEWDGGMITQGLYAGEHSTAAGRYQINVPTWKRCKADLNLPDFSPPSQDRAAAWLISMDGALNMVNGGRIVDAFAKCAQTWASLPGNTAGQPQKTMAALLNAYGNAGGAFA